MKSNDRLSGIHAMNFSVFDLNLLRVFDAMIDACNTTRAAEKVGLSQPAVSAALARLRHATGDPLFLREGNRMVPTARAEAMAAPIRTALAALESTLSAPEAFEPASASRRFRLLGADYFSTLFMPLLSVLVEAEAPGVVLQMLDLAAGPAKTLADGAVDLCLDIARPVPEWVEDRAALPVAPARRCGAGASAAGGRGARCGDPDGGLRRPAPRDRRGRRCDPRHGRRGARPRRRPPPVVPTLPHFHAVALAVAESTLVAALPAHFARAVAPRLGLEIYRLPVRSPRSRSRCTGTAATPSIRAVCGSGKVWTACDRITAAALTIQS